MYDYDVELRRIHTHDNGKPYIWNKCPLGYCTGDVIDVDDNMTSIIRELNIKGYKTKYCCGGYTFDCGANVYIMFQENYNFETLPAGFTFNKDDMTINSMITEPSTVTKQITINKLNTSLCEWVISLQSIRKIGRGELL